MHLPKGGMIAPFFFLGGACEDAWLPCCSAHDPRSELVVGGLVLFVALSGALPVGHSMPESSSELLPLVSVLLPSSEEHIRCMPISALEERGVAQDRLSDSESISIAAGWAGPEGLQKRNASWRSGNWVQTATGFRPKPLRL